jgi:hypothetical protein
MLRSAPKHSFEPEQIRKGHVSKKALATLAEGAGFPLSRE